MGCCTSKGFDEEEEVSISRSFLETLRNTVGSIGVSYDAKDITHKILDILDSYLRSRFLDNLISQINLPDKGYLVAESDLPRSVSKYLDENTRSLCVESQNMVNCFELLSNVILSSNFVPYRCDDTEKRYICQQFTSSKDYKSFLYDLTTSTLDPNNVYEYSDTYSVGNTSFTISPVESLIIDSIPHILNEDSTTGAWENFCKRNVMDPNQKVKLPSLQPTIFISVSVTATEKSKSEEKSEPIPITEVEQEHKKEEVEQEHKKEEVEQKPKIEEVEQEPKIEEVEQEPKIEEVEQEPKIEEVEQEPKIEEVEQEHKEQLDKNIEKEEEKASEVKQD